MAGKITIIAAIPAVDSAGLGTTMLATPPWANSQVTQMTYVPGGPFVDSGGIKFQVDVAADTPVLVAGTVGTPSDLAVLFAGGSCGVMTPNTGPAPVLGTPLVDPVEFGNNIYWSAVTGSGSTIPAGVMALEIEEVV